MNISTSTKVFAGAAALGAGGTLLAARPAIEGSRDLTLARTELLTASAVGFTFAGPGLLAMTTSNPIAKLGGSAIGGLGTGMVAAAAAVSALSWHEHGGSLLGE